MDQSQSFVTSIPNSPPDAAEAPQSSEELQSAFHDGIAEILSGQGDAPSKVDAIAALARRLLGVADNAGEEAVDACEEDDEILDDDSDQSESLQTPADWPARLKLLESREKARETLESTGILPHVQPAVNRARVAALVSVIDDSAQCEALVSTWKSAGSSSTSKPRSTAANVLESRNPTSNFATSFVPRTVEQMKREATMAFGR